MKSKLSQEFHDTQQIPEAQIFSADTNIRDVKTDSPSYKSLCLSVANDGVLKGIHLNPWKDEEGKIVKNKYAIIDGSHRDKANREAGHTTIRAHVAKRHMDKTECRVLQMILNITSTPQSKKESYQQIGLILAQDPNLTLQDLVDTTSIPANELNKIMNLSRLIPAAQEALADGKITVSSANELGRCSPGKYPGLQEVLLKEHSALPTDSFISKCRELRTATNKGEKLSKGLPTKYRNKAEVDTLYDNVQNKIESLEPGHPMNIQLAIMETLSWILQMDPESVQRREAKKTSKKTIVDYKDKLLAAKEEIANLKAGKNADGTPRD